MVNSIRPPSPARPDLAARQATRILPFDVRLKTLPAQFVPQPSLAGGHRMTFYAWARRRRFPSLSPPEVRYFDVPPRRGCWRTATGSRTGGRIRR